MNRDAFPRSVIDRLGSYVYRLIDPRNGETFYIGKGSGNRVFAHIRDALAEGDEVSDKLRRIRQIRHAGFDVAHVIHRHGLDDQTALEVEAALLDAYPGLTNDASGIGASEFGAMHAEEIIRKYEAEPAVFNHPVLLITIDRSEASRSTYEATRFAWKIDPERANGRIILACVRGLIVDAFDDAEWLEAMPTNFPGREARPGRYGFLGKPASEDIRRLYVGKRAPERKQGAANPIRYFNPGD